MEQGPSDPHRGHIEFAILKFVQQNSKKSRLNLRICNFCCTFAADFRKNRCRGGGIGRHEGLKILWPVMAVRVQVPLAVLKEKLKTHKLAEGVLSFLL